MTPLLTLVAYSALLTWAMLLIASQIRSKTWTPPGLLQAMGNRETAPPTYPLAGRVDRAAANMLENFVLFATLALIAHASGVQSPRILMGAQWFFWARLVYVPVYYLGIPYLRTGVWAVSVAGMGMMVMALLA